jgi:hypothetical protein
MRSFGPAITDIRSPASVMERAKMNEPKFVPVNLETAEVPKFAIDPERGERVQRGRVIAALPKTMKPCPVIYDEPVLRHDAECECAGSGLVPVRRPDIDAVDPEDDSLQALEDAIETGDANDSYLGDSVTNLMRHTVDVKGGGGGGGRTRARKASDMRSEPSPSATDGRLERTGRRPRFVRIGTRKDLIGTTVARTTAKVLEDVGSDAAQLADSLLANPEVQAILAEIKAEGAQ